jgi:prepilin-type N-terminal cleavage/methylation domain-containing protein
VGGGAHAFTLVEALIVISIIGLLAGIVLLTMGHARKGGDVAAERAMVVALRIGVEKFKDEFSTLPALVIETPDPVGPTDPTGKIFVWTTQQLELPDPTPLNGATSNLDRAAYSQYSLPYYLAGALDEIYDEIPGLGFTAPSPKHDGSFSRHGRKHDPFVDPTVYKTRTGANRLFVPKVAGSTASNQSARARCYILDRWSDGSGLAANDRPIRYYRWLPSYYPVGDPKAGNIKYWNIPIPVGGDASNPLDPPSRPELKSAEFAVVSAGPDRLFGDEDPAVIGNTLGVPVSTTAEIAAARAKAAADNIVEVGR